MNHPAVQLALECLPDSLRHRKVILQDIVALLNDQDPAHRRATHLLNLLYAHEDLRQQLLPLAGALPDNPVHTRAQDHPDSIGKPQHPSARILAALLPELQQRLYSAAQIAATAQYTDAQRLVRMALDILDDMRLHSQALAQDRPTLNQSQP